MSHFGYKLKAALEMLIFSFVAGSDEIKRSVLGRLPCKRSLGLSSAATKSKGSCRIVTLSCSSLIEAGFPFSCLCSTVRLDLHYYLKRRMDCLHFVLLMLIKGLGSVSFSFS